VSDGPNAAPSPRLGLSPAATIDRFVIDRSPSAIPGEPSAVSRSEPNLRIPGPTSLPTEVRAVGSRQMINHRGPEFAALLSRVERRMKPFFGTEQQILFLTCSGSGGLEAAVVNTLSPGDPVLAVSIGAFGDRLAKIAQLYGADVTKLDVEWGEAADPSAVAAALRANPGYKAVLVTHNETSTGVMNPLEAIAAAVHAAAPDALIVVDGVSGLGGVPFEMDGWGLDVVVTASQKTWMSAPAIAVIALSDRAWEANRTARMPRAYFDLATARDFAAKGETPWTPAIAVMFQLDVALDMMEREGRDNVYARHSAVAAATRAGLTALGFRLFADPAHPSTTVTNAWLPDGLDWKAFNNALLERDLVIAGGQGKLAGKTLRVGHLGDVDLDDILDVMRTLEAVLPQFGVSVTPGAGVAAAEAAGRAVIRGGSEAFATA
jgi:aspartate aminotransferase-like enzyme